MASFNERVWSKQVWSKPVDRSWALPVARSPPNPPLQKGGAVFAPLSHESCLCFILLGLQWFESV